MLIYLISKSYHLDSKLSRGFRKKPAVFLSSQPRRQLAATLRMNRTQYFRYEQGYRDIPSDILIALADLYHTSTDYILGRTDDSRFSKGKGGSQRGC